jgi:hypothetical protein
VTVTYASFIAEFPEFDGAGYEAVVTARLVTAALQTPEDVWGNLRDDGIKWLTADLVARSPQGRELRLVNRENDSIYSVERRRLEGIVSSGYRVTGAS